MREWACQANSSSLILHPSLLWTGFSQAQWGKIFFQFQGTASQVPHLFSPLVAFSYRVIVGLSGELTCISLDSTSAFQGFTPLADTSPGLTMAQVPFLCRQSNDPLFALLFSLDASPFGFIILGVTSTSLMGPVRASSDLSLD